MSSKGRASSPGITAGTGHRRTEVPTRWLPRLLFHFRQLDPVAQLGFFAAILTMVFAAIAIMPVVMPEAPPPAPSARHGVSADGLTTAEASAGPRRQAVPSAPAAAPALDPQTGSELTAKLAAAVASYLQGDATSAEATFRWVIDQSEMLSGSTRIEAEARRWLARIIRKAHLDEAMEEIRLATRLDPTNRQAWLDRSDLASDMGSVSEAAHAYTVSGEIVDDQSARVMTNEVAELLVKTVSRATTQPGRTAQSASVLDARAERTNQPNAPDVANPCSRHSVPAWIDVSSRPDACS